MVKFTFSSQLVGTFLEQQVIILLQLVGELDHHSAMLNIFSFKIFKI